MISKSQLRREINQKRQGLDATWVAESSQRIVEQLQGNEIFQTAEVIALYKAIAGEVDLKNLFPACWKEGKRTCMPVFNRTLKLYEMAEITADTPFSTGHYGIQEPVNPQPMTVDTIDLFVVPGVAFDSSGNRLGRGGGYYDRLLNGFNGTTVAVAFGFQLCPKIPTDSHDIPVDFVVTETKLLKV